MWFHSARNSLTTADLRSATYVGQSAFNGCRSLTSADLRSATTVGASAFNGCESLQT
ncbi:MAG: leucine-rich repeat protein, partial [Candidatus Methanomethylophilaceae archaeon]|nr:leucine-rich repeat protein [Candidatus Methanomethylophilaceae archaeon]